MNKAYKTLVAGVLSIVFAGPALGRDAAPPSQAGAAAAAALPAPASGGPSPRAQAGFVYPVTAEPERGPT